MSRRHCVCHRCQVLLTSLLLGLSAGCGNGVYLLDEEIARKSLATVLSTWKAGEASSSLESKSPKIVAIDYDWRANRKLIDFKLRDDDAPQGSNLRKSVELTLSSSSGVPVKVEAVYLVSTQPAITVVRQESE